MEQIENFFWLYLSPFFEGAVFVYGITLLVSYSLLAILSYKNIRLYGKKESFIDYDVILGSPLAPGVTVIAPAFNEAVTIIANVRSLLTLNYPKYEIIIINDGSTDNTLEQLIEEFALVKIEYAYKARIGTKPVRGIYKSMNDAYAKLIIVDKENGKAKADAANAGINVSTYNYFVCTDVDCILHVNTLQQLMRPIMVENKKRVMAVGATLRMVNSCVVDKGVIVKVRAPKPLLARFQEMEYIRSFILGKMGWSLMNAVPNVSGGLGMFDKDIVIKAGGYDPLAFGEDMELMMRMNRYVGENKIKASIRYIPATLCWTEGPTTLKILMRQRTRWARGLVQLMSIHKKMFFNPKYGIFGLLTYPYNFFFELIAPIIELLGFLYYLLLIFTNHVNWPFAIILLVFVYTYAVMISTLAVLWDQLTSQYYKSWLDVIRVCSMAFIELMIYHPMIVLFGLRGYFYHLIGKKHTWGNMQRQGFQQAKPKESKPAVAV